MKVICVVQARMGSTRLPGKVLMDLAGKPSLLHQIERLLGAKKIDHIVVATTTKEQDNAIVKAVKNCHPRVTAFQGSEMDVTDRYYLAVKDFHPDAVIRITGDCPLIDPEVVDKVIEEFINSKADYVANVLGKRTYPRGLDTEVFSFQFLEKMWKELNDELDRESITLYVRRNPSLFKCKNVTSPVDYSFHRWTLDERDDYELIKTIYQELYVKNTNFKMKDILELFKKRPELIKINQHIEQKNPHC